MGELDAVLWPLSRLAEAIDVVARVSALSPSGAAPPAEALTYDATQVGPYIASVARHLGLDAEPVDPPYAQIDLFLRQAGPAIVCIPGEGTPRFLALLRGGRSLAVVAPTHAVQQLRPEVVHTALGQVLEAPHVEWLEHVLDAVGVSTRQRPRARIAMLRGQLGTQPVRGCWLLRLPTSAPVWQVVHHARIPWRLLALVGAHAAQYLIWLLAWWLIGHSALQGRLDGVWLLTWALLLGTLIPFRLLSTWLQGLVATSLGELLKQRLLAGALSLDPDDIRHQGVGQLLGRVLESDTMESLALSGGFLGLVALIELILAMAILGVGAGGWLHVGALLGWLGCTGILSWRYVRHRQHWTAHRLRITHDLVECMVGYRTRLVQEPCGHWHATEDQAVERALTLAGPMDRMMALILSVVPRGWLVLGVLGLAPAFIAGQATPAALAVSLGGMLLAYRALDEFTMSLVHLVGAGIAWKQIAPLFHAAASPQTPGSSTLATEWQTPTSGETLMEAHDLVFRYGAEGKPVLQGSSVRIQVGDRLLLQGPSGGGKSTLASVLTGLRHPTSGLLLLRGLDPATLGAEGWRRRVVAAPQFHDNHVLSGTFAFNLLMGRRWPPRPEDLQEAERLCRELGLGELLDRMPAGLLQMVGETGWQLSHGEQSRLFIARALLQNADLVVLDESFAALDPDNLQRALRCVDERAATLLVIAHP